MHSHPGSYVAGRRRLVSDRDAFARAKLEMRMRFGKRAVPQILGDAGPLPLLVSDATQVVGSANIALRAGGGRARVVLTSFERRFLPSVLHVVLETGDGRRLWTGREVHVPHDAVDSVSYEIDASDELREDALLRIDRTIAPHRERPLRWRAHTRDERGRSLGLASIAWTRDPYLPRRYLHYCIPG